MIDSSSLAMCEINLFQPGLGKQYNGTAGDSILHFDNGEREREV